MLYCYLVLLGLSGKSKKHKCLIYLSHMNLYGIIDEFHLQHNYRCLIYLHSLISMLENFAIPNSLMKYESLK